MCESTGDLDEIRAEAAWAVQGAWMTIDSHHALASYWRASLPFTGESALTFPVRPVHEGAPPVF